MKLPHRRQSRLSVAAQHGRLRFFPGPDLAETHGLQCPRLSIRSDEVVFEDACVRAPGRNTADQQIGAGRRAGRGDPCAGRASERLETGDLAEGRGRGVAGSADKATGPRPVPSRSKRPLPYPYPRAG